MVAYFLLMLFSIDLETLAAKIENNNPLPIVTLLEDMENDHYRMRRLDENHLVLFSVRSKTIEVFDIAAKTIDVVARSGEGPAELRMGLLYGCVVDGRIVVSETGSSKIKAFKPSDKEFQAVYNDAFCSTDRHILLGERYIMGVVTAPGRMAETLGELACPPASLMLYEIQSDGTWKKHGAFYEEEILHHDQGDNVYSLNTHLFNTSKPNHFLRVPGWASPTMQIMNLQGEVVRALPIPHPFASKNPKSPALKLMRYQEAIWQRTVASASQDRQFRVHLLMDGLKVGGIDWSKRLIMVIDELGNLLSIRLLPEKIEHMVVADNGLIYFGINEQNDLLAFPTDQSF